MIMLYKGSKQQKGAASMIVVIFMSIILSIVTIGFVRLAINEQRDSTDEDLSNRAYFAAESGIEDAKRAIQEDLAGTLSGSLNENTCDAPGTAGEYNPELSATSEFDVEYTCMLLNFEPDRLRSELANANQTKQYEVRPIKQSGAGSSQPSYITLSWHMDAPAADDGDGDVGSSVVLRGATAATDIPRFGAWQYPAMMEVTMITYPQGSFSRGDVDSIKMFLSPHASNGSNGYVANVYLPGGSPNSALDGTVQRASCVNSDNNMSCSMRFDVRRVPALASSHFMEFRVTNHYVSTSFEISMENSVGTPLLFDGAQVIADVTGRAGEVYRRVEAAIELSDTEFVPNFSIQSATDICKDFSFTNVAAEFSGIPGTSCTN